MGDRGSTIAAGVGGDGGSGSQGQQTTVTKPRDQRLQQFLDRQRAAWGAFQALEAQQEELRERLAQTHAEINNRVLQEETSRVVNMLKDSDRAGTAQREMVQRLRGVVAAGGDVEVAQKKMVEELVAGSRAEVSRRVRQEFEPLRLEAEGEFHSRRVAQVHELENLENEVMALRGGLCEEAQDAGFQFGLAAQVRHLLNSLPVTVEEPTVEGGTSPVPSMPNEWKADSTTPPVPHAQGCSGAGRHTDSTGTTSVPEVARIKIPHVLPLHVVTGEGEGPPQTHRVMAPLPARGEETQLHLHHITPRSSQTPCSESTSKDITPMMSARGAASYFRIPGSDYHAAPLVEDGQQVSGDVINDGSREAQAQASGRDGDLAPCYLGSGATCEGGGCAEEQGFGGPLPSRSSWSNSLGVPPQDYSADTRFAVISEVSDSTGASAASPPGSTLMTERGAGAGLPGATSVVAAVSEAIAKATTVTAAPPSSGYFGGALLTGRPDFASASWGLPALPPELREALPERSFAEPESARGGRSYM
jgi:hypothetical protein